MSAATVTVLRPRRGSRDDARLHALELRVNDDPEDPYEPDLVEIVIDWAYQPDQDNPVHDGSEIAAGIHVAGLLARLYVVARGQLDQDQADDVDLYAARITTTGIFNLAEIEPCYSTVEINVPRRHKRLWLRRIKQWLADLAAIDRADSWADVCALTPGAE